MVNERNPPWGGAIPDVISRYERQFGSRKQKICCAAGAITQPRVDRREMPEQLGSSDPNVITRILLFGRTLFVV